MVTKTQEVLQELFLDIPCELMSLTWACAQGGLFSGSFGWPEVEVRWGRGWGCYGS